MVEGTSLLRKHMGLNLYRGFDSHRLRQVLLSPCFYRGFFIGSSTLVSLIGVPLSLKEPDENSQQSQPIPPRHLLPQVAREKSLLISAMAGKKWGEAVGN